MLDEIRPTGDGLFKRSVLATEFEVFGGLEARLVNTVRLTVEGGKVDVGVGCLVVL